MRTIAVIGRKGGSGKTTIAVHLAIGLHLRGRRTVMADIDPQRSAMEVLRARPGDGPTAIASAGPKLFTLQVDMARAGHDALVIDTPAVLEEDVAQAVVLADLALLVVRPTFLDLAAAVRTSDIIRRMRKPGLVVLSQALVGRGTAEALGGDPRPRRPCAPAPAEAPERDPRQGRLSDRGGRRPLDRGGRRSHRRPRDEPLLRFRRPLRLRRQASGSSPGARGKAGIRFPGIQPDKSPGRLGKNPDGSEV